MALVIVNSYPSVPYSASVWNDGSVPFVLPPRILSVTDVVTSPSCSRVSVPSNSEHGRCFEWKPFGIATLNALTLRSIRWSKRVLAQLRAANCQMVLFQETRRKFNDRDF